MNYYDDDEILTFKKKTSKKTKKKKTKEKTLEQIVKERQLKKDSEAETKLENERIAKDSKKKKLDELKKAEQTAIDFELNLLGDEFSNFSKDVSTNKVVQNEEGDEKVDYEFM